MQGLQQNRRMGPWVGKKGLQQTKRPCEHAHPGGSCCVAMLGGTRVDPSQFPFMLILQRLEEPKWCRTAIPSRWKGAPGSRVLSPSRHERRLRTPPALGLLGALPLALASFHDDQKGVENIYTNRLRAAVLMKHLCTRQTLNCPKMGHMCFINTPL